MGWTGTGIDHSRPVSAREAIATECGESWLARVVDCARKPLRYEDGYAAYAAVRDADDPSRVFGLVVLYSTSTSNWGGVNGRTLYTKAITEDMGPAEDECPARILKLLTPTENEYASQWRERCRARVIA
jgi:hypothetical protein